MFRTTRSLIRHLRPASFSQPAPASACRSLKLHQKQPLIPWQAARFASTGRDRADPPPPKPKIDREAERKIAQQKLQPDPARVSTESTTHKAVDNAASQVGQDDENINDGLKHDIRIVRDTFKLSNIPYESHVLGLAGTIPYLATSASTVYLGWDLTKVFPTGNSFYDSIFINHDTAQYLLSVIEPLQLGYGAVIISFLGAIHWGLEYAETKPLRERTRFRYGMGVAAPVVAWPTLLMPIEYGLTSQFMAFVALYVADSRASSRGWAPRWYAQYRFMLTAIVGMAILVSLVGRSELEKSERLSKEHLRSSMNRPGLADTETDWPKVEAAEKKRMKEEKEAKERKAKEDQKLKEKKQPGESDGIKDKKKDGSANEDKESSDKE